MKLKTFLATITIAAHNSGHPAECAEYAASIMSKHVSEATDADMKAVIAFGIHHAKKKDRQPIYLTIVKQLIELGFNKLYVDTLGTINTTGYENGELHFQWPNEGMAPESLEVLYLFREVCNRCDDFATTFLHRYLEHDADLSREIREEARKIAAES